MIWDHLISKTVKTLDKKIPIILNIAAIEQHGPALPMITDSAIGEHFLKTLDKELSSEIVILPQIKVGCSNHHMNFPGTLTVSHQTFMYYVSEILHSVYTHGFRNFILFNSHGGNMGIGQTITEAFGAAHPAANIVFTSWWTLVRSELAAIQRSKKGGVGHACEFEHALMELIYPALIDGSVDLSDEELYPTFPWAEADLLHAPAAYLYKPFHELTKNGIYGKPSLASRKTAEAITHLVVKKLITIVRDLHNISPSVSNP